MAARRSFTVKEKMEIISKLKNGENNTDLCKEYKVSHSTISTMWKNRDKILECFESKSLKMKKNRKSMHQDVENALLMWLKAQRSQNVSLSGRLLQEKANHFARLFGKIDFECSESWIYRFRQRHDIVVGEVCGEAASVSQSDCDTCLKTVFPKLTEDYTDSQIWNADETDDGEELHKVTDVWRYFDTDSGKNAQCVVCKSIVLKDYEELKTHLRDNHPNLLLEILQDQPSDHSDAGSNNGNEDNDNTYTEIVYLEQEPVTETVRKRKEKKSFVKPQNKRERQPSAHSSDDLPLKKTKKVEEENDELTTFIKYITCLLKKLPAEVFSNVQIEIINTILKANNEAKAANTSPSIVINRELLNTSTNIITVDGITPVTSTVMGNHNYTISVTSPNESKTEINS